MAARAPRRLRSVARPQARGPQGGARDSPPRRSPAPPAAGRAGRCAGWESLIQAILKPVLAAGDPRSGLGARFWGVTRC